MNFFGVIERAAAPFLATFIRNDVRRRSNVQREPDVGKTSRNDSGEKEFQVTFVVTYFFR